MTDSPNLALPYILAAQSQKHVTHNEAIRALDCLVQLSVADRDLTAPPPSPADGARYLVAAGATDAWAGQTDKIAAFQDGAWIFYQPRDGWIVWIADENTAIVYASGAWSVSFGGGGGVTDHGVLTGLADDDHPHYLNTARGDARYTPINPATLGINAAADATNRLAVAAAASLFNHAGNGHQVKVSKNAASDTASFLFQTNFSGRAEMGTTGDDNFHFKVSSDGTTWHEALTIDRTSGKVSTPLTPKREILTSNRTYFVRPDGSDSNTGLANTSGGAFKTPARVFDEAVKLDFNGYSVIAQLADGTYSASGVSITRPLVGGTLVFKGNAGNPSGVVFAGTFNCFHVACPYTLTVQDMTLAPAAGMGLVADGSGARINFSNVVFAGVGPGQYHMRVLMGGTITTFGNYEIAGGAARHLSLEVGGVFNASGITVTLTGTPAWSDTFILCNILSLSSLFSVTYSGAATGKRYTLIGNSVLNSYGAGSASTYFPGNVNGTTASGAQQL
jgi:hypothetical protein